MHGAALKILFVTFCLCISVAQTVHSTELASSKPDELAARLVLYDGTGGASCSHFLANALEWERKGGDWVDARGKRFGDHAYASATIGAQGAIWDVTDLAKKWFLTGVNRGSFFLKVVAGSGFAAFHSRESKSVADWPILELQFSNGVRKLLKPTADTFLDCSTYTSLGTRTTIEISRQRNVLLQFSLPDKVAGASLDRARLVLSAAGSPGGGVTQIGVFEIATPAFPQAQVQRGLAAKYVGDRGIEQDPEVIFSAKFDDSSSWRSGWAKESSGEVDIVSADTGLQFSPHFGSALRVNVKKGRNMAADLRLKLKELGGEPDELFFRYYLRLASDWNPTIADGKLPGMVGTYNRAGWGGRRVDGTDGWSMRGSFTRGFEIANPLHGLTQLGSYAYHADMQGTYGDIWQWPGALLERNRWYSIEQYIRLNQPDTNNGILKVWLDGRLLFAKTNLRLRTVDKLHIEWVWLDVYHGGAEVSLQDMHLYFDDVVVARKYVGPIANAGGQ
jgi:hypothetical protein